jgi:predicted dehydrogenase
MRTAVIGAGYIAREHLAALREIGVEVAAICDRSPALAEALAEEHGVPHWFDDAERMLRAVAPDVVHVATPPRSHVALARAALEAGAHVFVEKPIALNPSELRELQELAVARGRWLVEDHNYRFNPAIQRIIEWADSGALGAPVHVDVLFAVDALGPGSRHADPNAPDPFSGLPGGPILDFITHLAYLACAFLGEHREVATQWGQRGGSGARWDEFRALVRAERGTAALAFSANAQPDTFSVTVHGTRLRARASLFEPLLAVERLHGGPRPLLPVRNGLAVAAAHAHAAVAGLWRKLAGQPVTYAGLWELLRRFYAALEAGAKPPIAPAEIAAANRLVFAMLEQEPRR